MSFPNWQTILLEEHSLLLNLLEKLTFFIENFESKKKAYSELKNFLHYLLEFGDKIHNVKEENHLFSLMVLHGIPQEGLIKQMLLDHEYEREFLARALMRLSRLEAPSPEDQRDLFDELEEYCRKRKIHIQQESEKLYMQAQSVIQEEDTHKLLSAFAIIDKNNNSLKLLRGIQRLISE